MLRSVVVNGYEIVMEDEQYNDVLSRAKKLRDSFLSTKISIDECIVWVIGDDIEEYRHKKGLW